MVLSGILELTEAQPLFLPTSSLSEDSARKLFGIQGLELQYPSPNTGGQFRLLAMSTVGHIPVDSDLTIRVAPKVPVPRIFQMLEVAYNLKSFRLFNEVVRVDAFEGLFERLASILASLVLDRGRRGLYRCYEERSEPLPYVSGRLRVEATARSLACGEIALHCEYEEFSADIAENQILLWTLNALLSADIARHSVRANVRSARRMLTGTISNSSFLPAECVARSYNRLSADYEPMHAICRLVLEAVGPGISAGEFKAMPFTVNMASLFELFVANWLCSHLPSNVRLISQHQVNLDSAGRVTFKMDLVLFDTATGRALAVLDTKYKAPDSPSTDDVQQVIAYAAEVGASRAYLIYPTALSIPIDVPPTATRNIRVKSVAFRLQDDLDASGYRLLQEMEFPEVLNAQMPV